MADAAVMASLVGVVAVLFDMSSPIAEETLIDLQTLLSRVSGLHAPFAGNIVVFRAMLPPIGEVVLCAVSHFAGRLGSV